MCKDRSRDGWVAAGKEERGGNLRAPAAGRESSIHTQAFEVPFHGQGKENAANPTLTLNMSTRGDVSLPPTFHLSE